MRLYPEYTDAPNSSRIGSVSHTMRLLRSRRPVSCFSGIRPLTSPLAAMYSPSESDSAYSCWFARFVTMLYFSSGWNDAVCTSSVSLDSPAEPNVPVTNTCELDTPTLP